MPRAAVEENSRMSLRIRPDDKALLMRAVAYTHTDLTDFVLRHALQAAKAVIAHAEQVALSERDYPTCPPFTAGNYQDGIGSYRKMVVFRPCYGQSRCRTGVKGENNAAYPCGDRRSRRFAG